MADKLLVVTAGLDATERVAIAEAYGLASGVDEFGIVPAGDFAFARFRAGEV